MRAPPDREPPSMAPDRLVLASRPSRLADYAWHRPTQHAARGRPRRFTLKRNRCWATHTARARVTGRPKLCTASPPRPGPRAALVVPNQGLWPHSQPQRRAKGPPVGRDPGPGVRNLDATFPLVSCLHSRIVSDGGDARPGRGNRVCSAMPSRPVPWRPGGPVTSASRYRNAIGAALKGPAVRPGDAASIAMTASVLSMNDCAGPERRPPRQGVDGVQPVARVAHPTMHGIHRPERSRGEAHPVAARGHGAPDGPRGPVGMGVWSHRHGPNGPSGSGRTPRAVVTDDPATRRAARKLHRCQRLEGAPESPPARRTDKGVVMTSVVDASEMA